jgi:hypothetical protein
MDAALKNIATALFVVLIALGIVELLIVLFRKSKSRPK